MKSKSVVTWGLIVYGAILVIAALAGVKSGCVNLLPLSGVIVALTMYLKRYESVSVQKFASRIITMVIILTTAISVILSLFGGNIFYSLIGNIVGGITMLVLIAACNKKLNFVVSCDMTIFIIAIVASLTLLPFILGLLNALIVFVLSLLVIAAIVLFVFSEVQLPEREVKAEQEKEVTFIDIQEFKEDSEEAPQE